MPIDTNNSRNCLTLFKERGFISFTMTSFVTLRSKDLRPLVCMFGVYSESNVWLYGMTTLQILYVIIFSATLVQIRRWKMDKDKIHSRKWLWLTVCYDSRYMSCSKLFNPTVYSCKRRTDNLKVESRSIFTTDCTESLQLILLYYISKYSQVVFFSGSPS